jgi:hypothetical protein
MASYVRWRNKHAQPNDTSPSTPRSADPITYPTLLDEALATGPWGFRQHPANSRDCASLRPPLTQMPDLALHEEGPDPARSSQRGASPLQCCLWPAEAADPPAASIGLGRPRHALTDALAAMLTARGGIHLAGMKHGVHLMNHSGQDQQPTRLQLSRTA